jgi:hypothetical protein
MRKMRKTPLGGGIETMSSPSTNGLNGRGAGGRFAAGNPGGPGNPHAKRVAALRAALLDGVTPEDVTEVVRLLVTAAKAGNVPAARELLDRCLGKSTLAVDLTLLEPPDDAGTANLTQYVSSLAQLGVPFERWGIMAQVNYDRWDRGEQDPPPGFAETRKLVEANCKGWVQAAALPGTARAE